jgi:hypothetical protein
MATKYKTIYVCVNTVSKTDGWHIGTIKATNDVELNYKLKIALDSHFDADTIFEPQSLKDIMYGKTTEFKIDFAFESFSEQIEIIETWLY